MMTIFRTSHKSGFGWNGSIYVNGVLSLKREYLKGGNELKVTDSFGNAELFKSGQTGYQYVKILKGKGLISLENTDNLVEYRLITNEQLLNNNYKP